ncbi:MAG: Holliday junction resolvase RuvX [Planctomycetota bacterium]|nr:Holliday junction resolvase RuvX [Planctomycetota bacterium]MCZ6611263.1 Holliday junction resolvase RuvX [Planctomycetota bacterium]MCZ6734181.1 Holliday junction resolvase RuvX [Planctomycetota bacterium]
MRYLAIDLGERRTGLAVGDDQTGVVTPLSILELPRGEGLIEALLKALQEHSPDEIVLGLPLNMDGTEGAPAKRVREFAKTLRKRCECVVHCQDERLTSYAADQRMARTGRTHKQKKGMRDALAAAEILRDFLDKSGSRA